MKFILSLNPSRDRYFYLLLFLPIIGMILVNEYSRHTTTEKGYQIQEVTAVNSAKKYPQKCSWICHNDTDFCKQNHVKLVTPIFQIIDPIYFGIINSLKSTGNYGLANVVILGVILPFLMILLFIKSLQMQSEIRRLRNSK